MQIKERYNNVISFFKENQPDAQTELYYKNPFELLVAVILSAQCTDKRVNMTTPSLFKKYPTPISMSEAKIEDVFQYIKSISYPNNKAKYLVRMSKMLVEEFNNKIPNQIKELLRLPGVGRKSANVITSIVYNQARMAVDTHVFRVSGRIGLTHNAKTPLETEKQLVKYIPKKYVAIAHHWLILHGRYICVARKPKCSICGIAKYCKYYNTTNP